MRNLKFPEIDKKIQQSVYGAWGGSNSNEPPPIDGGWLDNVNVGPSGGSSGGSGGYGSGGSWDFGDNGFYDNGGYWGDAGSESESESGSGSEFYGQIPNLPTTVEQQLGPMGACVSYAMSFMSGVLGHPIAGATMALHNGQILNLPWQTTVFTGLTPSESAIAIQSYFYTTVLTNTTQIINAIEIGKHGVLANLFVYDAQNNVIPNIGHEVALVGYDAATGLFMTADSSTGAYETYTASQINVGMGVYQINGVKP